jgi:hypothetical protein
MQNYNFSQITINEPYIYRYLFENNIREPNFYKTKVINPIFEKMIAAKAQACVSGESKFEFKINMQCLYGRRHELMTVLEIFKSFGVKEVVLGDVILSQSKFCVTCSDQEVSLLYLNYLDKIIDAVAREKHFRGEIDCRHRVYESTAIIIKSFAEIRGENKKTINDLPVNPDDFPLLEGIFKKLNFYAVWANHIFIQSYCFSGNTK